MFTHTWCGCGEWCTRQFTLVLIVRPDCSSVCPLGPTSRRRWWCSDCKLRSATVRDIHKLRIEKFPACFANVFFHSFCECNDPKSPQLRGKIICMSPSTNFVMQWLQLRFEFDSTAVRRPLSAYQRSLRSQWRNPLPQSYWPVYLFRPQCAAAHTQVGLRS